MTTFDAVAQEYDRTVESSLGMFGREIDFFHRNKIHHLARVARYARIDLQAAHLLDVGCGTGAADRMLRPRVSSLAGADVSREMVAEARAAGADIDHRVYDGGSLPFDPGTFDLAFAFNVMHHVPPTEWTRFAAQMMTAVRPGGLCVIIEHNRLNPITRRSVRNCPFDAEAVLVSPADLRRAFGGAGAEFIARWYILFAPFGDRRAFSVEQFLSWLPFGGQYLYAVRRPEGP